MPSALVGHGVIRRTLQLVGHANGVEHAPQHIELELQDLQHALLCFAGAVVFKGDAQAVFDIAARLFQTLAEDPFACPCVPLRKNPVVALRSLSALASARNGDGRTESGHRRFWR